MQKASQFVVFSEPVAGVVAAFSTLTQNLVVFDQDEAERFRSGNFDEPDELRRLGFITDHDEDESMEAEKLRKLLIARRGDGLGVTVVPSIGCNFSCNYCYNGIHAYKPGDSGASFEAAMRYASDNLKPNTSLNVTWYGGEPLLFQKKIPQWSAQFIDLARQRNCVFRSDILTNGSTISDNTSELLLASCITRMQVSIDWPAAWSNRKFKHLSPEDSVVRILENINLVADEIRVTLRINTAPGFLATFDELISMVRSKVSRKIGIYCHRLYTSNDESLNDSNSASLRYDHTQGYATDFVEAKKIIRSFGFYQEYFPEVIPTGQCIAQTGDDVIFNHEGSMRKCPREVVGEGAVVQLDGSRNAQAAFYHDRSPSADLDCKRCSYLPVCHGGCVKEYFHEPEEKLNRCTLWRFTLKDELTNFLIDQKGKGPDYAQGESDDRG